MRKRSVRFESDIARLIMVMAEKETGGKFSAMVRKLVEEALKSRGELS